MTTCCILGLGYIGLPTAAVLARAGHRVIGVDVNAEVAATVNQGQIHIVEPDLDQAVADAVAAAEPPPARGSCSWPAAAAAAAAVAATLAAAAAVAAAVGGGTATATSACDWLRRRGLFLGSFWQSGQRQRRRLCSQMPEPLHGMHVVRSRPVAQKVVRQGGGG